MNKNVGADGLPHPRLIARGSNPEHDKRRVSFAELDLHVQPRPHRNHHRYLVKGVSGNEPKQGSVRISHTTAALSGFNHSGSNSDRNLSSRSSPGSSHHIFRTSLPGFARTSTSAQAKLLSRERKFNGGVLLGRQVKTKTARHFSRAGEVDRIETPHSAPSTTRQQPTRTLTRAKAIWLQRRRSSVNLAAKQEEEKTVEDTHETTQPIRPSGRGREKFRHSIKLVLILLKWITSLSEREGDEERGGGKTFTDIASEALISSSNRNSNLSFDVAQFKAKKEVQLSTEVRHTLTIPSSHRTQEQITNAVYGLQHLKAFADYPTEIQEKLCRAAWFQQVPPRRVIIRQGHYAENFYFIVSGQALVRELEKNEDTGETHLRTVSVLKKGTSFGELALLHHAMRSATVVSRDAVQLLSISRGDFVDIFMKKNDDGGEPDHIRFLYVLPLLKEWPISKLQERPEYCLCHYFKRGVVIVENSQHSDWIYAVKSGSCQVLKQLKPLKRPHSGRELTSTPENPARRTKLFDRNVYPKVFTNIRVPSIKMEIPQELKEAQREYLRTIQMERANEKGPAEDELEPDVSHSKALSLRRLTHKKLTTSLSNISPGTKRLSHEKLSLYSSNMKPANTIPRTISPPDKSKSLLTPTTQVLFKTPRGEHQETNDFNNCTKQQETKNVVKTKSMEDGGSPPVFIQVDVLKPKDIFGLTNLCFDDEIPDEESSTVSLVSNGAECVMLSKKFFTECASPLVRQQLRENIKPYPTDHTLQMNLQVSVDWGTFKQTTINETVSQLQRRKKKIGYIALQA